MSTRICAPGAVRSARPRRSRDRRQLRGARDQGLAFVISPGNTVSITGQVKNTDSDRVEGINLVLTLSDPFGREIPGSERIVTGQTFGPGQGRNYQLQWRAPDDLTPGLYPASIGGAGLRVRGEVG